MSPAKKSSLPPSYFEGFIEKDGTKLWTCLRGNTLYFYKDSKNPTYTEKLELGNFVSLTDNQTNGKNYRVPTMILKLTDCNVKLKATSLETHEQWKGFILSVTQLEVPRCLTLLPGQIHALQDVVLQETMRQNMLRQTLKPSDKETENDYEDVLNVMPKCFYQVSRTEAENLLRRHPQCGNLLLRPSRDGISNAITTCLEHQGTTKMMHYRVKPSDDGFILDVVPPIFRKSLQDIIDAFVEKTDKTTSPLILDQSYEDTISFVKAEKESGEQVLQKATGSSVPLGFVKAEKESGEHVLQKATGSSVPLENKEPLKNKNKTPDKPPRTNPKVKPLPDLPKKNNQKAQTLPQIHPKSNFAQHGGFQTLPKNFTSNYN
ncbi:signal-transducing adaptor protein 1-like isoform X1 [Erpetoichthys calabaricus]|uniref:signal-transducing adaptor protein 1-like isoform X1 n=1 Tax=Erpetoichthys calabaricus TaxID=27687 RepID=UPI0010A05A6C|nr:signal-transducing adaptor protein 1-like isoform X1 [Erpetoichthys calabaricus]